MKILKIKYNPSLDDYLNSNTESMGNTAKVRSYCDVISWRESIKPFEVLEYCGVIEDSTATNTILLHIDRGYLSTRIRFYLSLDVVSNITVDMNINKVIYNRLKDIYGFEKPVSVNKSNGSIYTNDDNGCDLGTTL